MHWLGGLLFANCVTAAYLFTVLHVISPGIHVFLSSTPLQLACLAGSSKSGTEAELVVAVVRGFRS